MRRKHWFGLIIAVLFALTFLPVAVYAVPDLDPDKACTLDVTFRNDEKAFADVNVQIYQVARTNADGSFDTVGVFNVLPIDIEGLVMSDIEAAVETLESYIGLNAIDPYCTGTSNNEGRIVIDDLNPGLYLVSAGNFFCEGYEYTVESVLVFMPSYDSDSGEWIYETYMVPKFEGEPQSPDDDTVERKVLKIWDDDGKESERPASVRVYLLCDGEIRETVLLSEGNNWRYTWSGLDADHDWTVAEDVPYGYTVSVIQEGITFVITNTRENPPPSYPPESPTPSVPVPTTPPPTSPPELPQTGLLWWPVPVFAVLGMILFLIGYICSRRTNGEE